LQKSAISKLKNISPISDSYHSIYQNASNSLGTIVEKLESAKSKLETYGVEENVYCHNLTQELSQIISEIRTLQASTLFQEQQIIHDKDLVNQRNSLQISQLRKNLRNFAPEKMN